MGIWGQESKFHIARSRKHSSERTTIVLDARIFIVHRINHLPYGCRGPENVYCLEVKTGFVSENVPLPLGSIFFLIIGIGNVYYASFTFHFHHNLVPMERSASITTWAACITKDKKISSIIFSSIAQISRTYFRWFLLLFVQRGNSHTRDAAVEAQAFRHHSYEEADW